MVIIMKKTLLAIPVAAALLATGAAAHTNGGLLGDIPSTTEAVKVDAKKDAIYDKGLTVNVDQQNGNTAVRATAVAKAVYNGGKLYVYAEVKDAEVITPTADAQNKSPWTTDSFEVFINPNNNDNNKETHQYRIDNAGFPSYYNQNGVADYGSKADSHFTYAAAKIDGGYAVEFCIPVESKEIGINFQVNDVVKSGAQALAMAPSKVTGKGSGSWTPTEYPYVTIGKTSVSLPKKTETAAATADASLIAALAAVASAAGAVVAKKKK